MPRQEPSENSDALPAVGCTDLRTTWPAATSAKLCTGVRMPDEVAEGVRRCNSGRTPPAAFATTPPGVSLAAFICCVGMPVSSLKSSPQSSAMTERHKSASRFTPACHCRLGGRNSHLDLHVCHAFHTIGSGCSQGPSLRASSKVPAYPSTSFAAMEGSPSS